MAYGGWACWDTVFEGNFCTNVRAATNIDSLNCRNVTFRNNVFLDCREVGILVNVGGADVPGHGEYSMQIGDETVMIARSQVDGLVVTGNLVQMRDGAPYAAIQAQGDGLRNVRITGNVLRTNSGTGRAQAIGVWGKEANATITGNVCEPGMVMVGTPLSVFRDNLDMLGQAARDRDGNPVDTGG